DRAVRGLEQLLRRREVRHALGEVDAAQLAHHARHLADDGLGESLHALRDADHAMTSDSMGSTWTPLPLSHATPRASVSSPAFSPWHSSSRSSTTSSTVPPFAETSALPFVTWRSGVGIRTVTGIVVSLSIRSPRTVGPQPHDVLRLALPSQLVWFLRSASARSKADSEGLIFTCASSRS